MNILLTMVILLPMLFSTNTATDAQAAGKVYFVSPSGSDSAAGTQSAPFKTIQKGLDTVRAGDTLTIRGGTYKEKLVLNSSGTASAPITISGYQGEQAVIDGSGISVDGLFKIPGKSNIKLSNLTVKNSAKIGIYVIGGATPSTNITLSGLTVLNSGDAAIKVQKVSNVTVQKNVIKECVSSGIGIWTSDHVKVDGNTIVNCHWQTQELGGHEESLTISKTNNFEVLNNELYFQGVVTPLGAAGICVKQWSYQGTVHHNYIHDYSTNSGILIDAEDAGLNGNPTLHDVNVYANRINNIPTGISLSSEWNSVPSGILESVNVYNNIITKSSFVGIRFNANDGDGPRRNINVYNNTLYDAGGTAGILVLTTNIKNIVIRNNVSAPGPNYKNARIMLANKSVASEVTVDHNIVQGTTTCPSVYPNCKIYTTGNLQTDPQFVNSTGGDLHLKSTSPAINAGALLNLVTNDYEGTPRPQGSAYDFGAYEFH